MQAKSNTFNLAIRTLLFLGLLMTFVILAESASAATLCVDPGGGGGCYTTIQAAVNAAAVNDTINVHAGTYDEDVNVNKQLTLLGADASTTSIRGVIGGDSATIRISSSNVTVEGFTITRLGNNVSDWNNAGLNSAGIAIQGTAITGTMIQNNILTGNRTGIDINHSSGHTVSNNTITFNRTGMLFRNTTDSMTVLNNEITDNWTMGILFLDASGGTNSPVQSALSSTFSNNNLSGNWYGQVVERQTGGSLPVPGTTNLKNFVGNWWGTATPVVSVANSTEPGYSAQIPVAYGGTAVPPGGQPDILGPASANIIYLPLCFDVACTKPVHNVTQSLDYLTIQSAVDAAASGDEIHADAGTYVEDLVIDKALTLLGPNAAINPNTGSRLPEAILHPATTGVDPNGTCTVMAYMETSNITIKGFTFDGDNPGLSGGAIINGADVDACEILAGYEGMGNITVENNILKRATYAGIDFYNYTNSNATSSNYIRYNRFEDIGETTYNWGMGVLIYNNFYAAITDNVMTGVRVGIQTGNFFRSNPGATNSISDNKIGSWRLGIFHNLWYSAASPLTVSNNTMTAENYTGATNYSGILLASMGTTVGATVTGNTITVPGTDTHSGYTTGYNVWNVQNGTPITLNGGTVTGGKYGVFVNNYEGYSSNANNTSIIVDGVAISDSATAGVYVLDSASNTNGATVNATAQNNTISNAATGILVEGNHGNASLTTSNVTATATGDALLVRSGGSVTANNTLDLNGDVTISSGGTLSAGTSSEIQVAGDWTNNGTFTAGTGKVKFDGAVAQSIGGAATTFNDLDLSNTHTSGITSSVNATVNGALAMNQASNLNMGANTLTMGTSSAAATTGTGQGDVVGTVTRTSFTSGTTYNFGSPFLAFGNLTFATAPTDISVTLATSAPGTFSSAIHRTYTINVTGGTTVNTNLRLHYRDDALNGNAEGALDAYRYDGTDWDDHAATTRNPSDNWVQRDSVSTFSDWTLSDGAPTSVTLTKFSGHKTDGAVELNWETGSELNLIGFNVWRARGKGEFTKLNTDLIPANAIGSVNGSTYTYTDSPTRKGKYTYKLEIVSSNNSSQWSDVVTVRVKKSAACATAPRAPKFLSPQADARLDARIVLLKWKALPCATHYTISLRADSSDGTLVAQANNLQAPEFQTKRLSRGKTYWATVQACNTQGCGAGQTRQFHIQGKKE